MKRFLLLALVLAAPAPGESPYRRTVVFHSFPPGARVLLHSTVRPQPDAIGVSGQPLDWDWQPFVDANGRLSARITLDLEDHQPASLQVDNDLLNGRWPPNPGDTVQLQPRSALVALRDLLLFRTGLVVLLAALLGGLVGAPLLWLRQTRLGRRLAERETELLKVSEVTGDDPFLHKTVGGYYLDRRLGAGGMAVVYRGVPQDAREDLGRAVAVKIMNPGLDDGEFLQRLEREVKLCKELDHPNIVRLVDWNIQKPVYLAMELVEGDTLRPLVRPGGLPPAQALPLLRQLIEATAFAHSKGVVHRDLKPENVMLTTSGKVKIMDFGLARRVAVSRKITATGTALGTPAYMAPEQIHGDLEAATDQYALGVMAYEMLSGSLPFDSEDPMAVIFRKLSEAPPPLANVRPDLAAVVTRMLALDPRQRFATLDDVLRSLPQE